METKEFLQEMDATRENVEREGDSPFQRGRDKPKEKNLFALYIEKRREKGNPALEATLCFLFLAMGFFFAKTAVVFGAIPLGVGLLCARRDRLPEIGLGMVLGLFSLGAAGLVYGAGMILVLLGRLAMSKPRPESRFWPASAAYFSEAPELRFALATVVGMLLGVYQLLVGGVSTQTLLFGLAMVTLCPVAAVAFYFAFEKAPSVEALIGKTKMPDMERRDSLLWKIGGLATLCALVFCLVGVELFGISLSLALAGALTFFLGKRFGGLSAMVAGLCLGAVTLPIYAPAFALAGLVSGVLWPLGGFFALGLGVAGGTVWSAFIGGLGGFLTVFPELSMVAVLLLPLLKQVKRDPEAEGVAVATADRPLPVCFVENATEEKVTEEKMLKLSSTLSSLSKLYQNFRSDLAAPKMEASVTSALALCTKRCQGCAHHGGCWGEEEGAESPIAKYLTQAVDRLYHGRSVEDLPLPQAIRQSCAIPDAILEDARTTVGGLVKSETEQKKQAYPTLEYDIAGAMMRDVVKSERAAKWEDPKRTKDAKALLDRVGIRAEAVGLLGQKYKTFFATGISRKPTPALLETLQVRLEELCGCKLSPMKLEQQGKSWQISAHSIPKMAVETAVVMRSATPDQVSGDTVRFFEKEEGSFCVLLSDGMGSGVGASAVSGLCVSFLQKLMEAGCHRNTAVKLLNQTIRTMSEVGSTTLDMAELDLLYGDAVFLKAGAAASYVKRGTQLFRIRSKTIPLGLMKTPDTEKTTFRLEAGDVVVMLSDGISQMPEDSPALCSLLAADWGEQSLQESAGRILSAALTSSERADDMTVVLLRICGTVDTENA